MDSIDGPTKSTLLVNGQLKGIYIPAFASFFFFQKTTNLLHLLTSIQKTNFSYKMVQLFKFICLLVIADFSIKVQSMPTISTAER